VGFGEGVRFKPFKPLELFELDLAATFNSVVARRALPLHKRFEIPIRK